MSKIVVVDFKARGQEALATRYPYIVAWCQNIGYKDFTCARLLKQAEKDRPGRYALYPRPGVTGKHKWQTLHTMPDEETIEVLMSLVSLKGLQP